MLFGSIISFMLLNSFFFVFFFLFAALSLMRPLGKLPDIMANSWRMKASNQMVLCIFYVVTYMRHTSNLELAIEFASEHLAPPLSLDLKKVLWDVETEKYESVKESMDIYLESWKKWNMEFIESFHLIESSLYEGDEDRRLNSLDKALDVILEETYEKMLHYAHNLKSPITMLHMLGIIMPILGLVILPLMVSFMDGVEWYHLSAVYNVALPIAVYFLGKQILSKRPTGYGETNIAEANPEMRKYKNKIIRIGSKEILIKPSNIAVIVAIVLIFIGFMPLLLHFTGFPDIGFGEEDPVNKFCGYKFCLLGYDEEGDGPFEIGASVLSLLVTLGAGLGLGLYYKMKSSGLIEIRERSKKLELEFASALFQLGNRLGDGQPAEIAFSKVSGVMDGTVSGKFFDLVTINIRKLGMSVKQAIFNPKYGAIVSYPSNLIESSMKVLIESIKKGPMIAAQALTNVSRYIKEIHRVNERLKDLLADIISSMTSQIKFLAPAIAGIVIGITSMVSTILSKLGGLLSQASSQGGEGMASIGGSITTQALFGKGIPTFYFQIIVGLYVVEIVYILTILANGIENGSDKLNEEYLLGKNLIKSTTLYCIIAFVVMLIFNLIARSILSATMSV